jgi:hypothetical protein
MSSLIHLQKEQKKNDDNIIPGAHASITCGRVVTKKNQIQFKERHPLDRRLGWPQSRSGSGGEGKNSQPLPGLEPPIHSVNPAPTFLLYYSDFSVSLTNDVVCLFFTEHHAMKAYWGSGGIAPLILWPRHEMEVNVQLHAPTFSPPRRELLLHIG